MWLERAHCGVTAPPPLRSLGTKHKESRRWFVAEEKASVLGWWRKVLLDKKVEPAGVEAFVAERIAALADKSRSSLLGRKSLAISHVFTAL